MDNKNWTDIPVYKKILKDVVEDFIDLLELEDYEETESASTNKKEIAEHFDKLFKDPEFCRLITRATD